MRQVQQIGSVNRLLSERKSCNDRNVHCSWAAYTPGAPQTGRWPFPGALPSDPGGAVRVNLLRGHCFSQTCDSSAFSYQTSYIRIP